MEQEANVRNHAGTLKSGLKAARAGRGSSMSQSPGAEGASHLQGTELRPVGTEGREQGCGA